MGHALIGGRTSGLVPWPIGSGGAVPTDTACLHFPFTHNKCCPSEDPPHSGHLVSLRRERYVMASDCNRKIATPELSHHQNCLRPPQKPNKSISERRPPFFGARGAGGGGGVRLSSSHRWRGRGCEIAENCGKLRAQSPPPSVRVLRPDTPPLPRSMGRGIRPGRMPPPPPARTKRAVT